MRFILKLLLSAAAVLLLTHFLPGVKVDSFSAALWVVIVIAILNVLLKPILVLLTIPVTILTLGLFLFVINAVIILVADALISGFAVQNFLWALVFSFVLSAVNYIIDAIVGEAN